jgi:transposase
MGEYSEAFVALDPSKTKHAVAIAEGERGGEVRFVGDVASSPARVERLTRKLAGRYDKLHFCYEAGPTGYGLYRQIRELGHDCTVVAPSLIPKKRGERIKTNRRDAVPLARLLRAGELTAVWVPDATHEAVRDLVRARGGRPRTCGASASSCCRSCCGTAASTAAGNRRTGAGWRAKASRIRPSRSCLRTRSRRLKRP